MRIISLDTETTGLLFYEGHRVIEIACIEIINEKITSNAFHAYLNPKRAIDKNAKKITGISESFLEDKPEFKDIVEDFLNFIKNSNFLIMHNAQFDINFINNELKLIDNKIKNIRNHFNIIDTLDLARKMHPGKKNNLDSLCKRYDVSTSERNTHSAIIDAKLLANVYIKMNKQKEKLKFKKTYNIPNMLKISTTKLIKSKKEELSIHKKYIEKIKNEKK